MRCPFCAEEIQDEAILCRFCGATRGENGDEHGWTHSPRTATGSDGGPGFMLRASGVLLLLGAAFEMMPPTSPVPLLGEMRAGAPAILYHVVFASTFFAVGVGLWRGTAWAYRATVVATALYSLDRIALMLDSGARQAMVSTGLGKHPMARDMIDLQSMDRVLQLFAGVAMLGFWGLLLLVHRRRGELTPSSDAP